MTTPKDIALALEHHRELNDGEKYWATFEAIQHSEDIRTVRVEIGIKIFGYKERAIASRHYFLDRFNQVNWYEAVHP